MSARCCQRKKHNSSDGDGGERRQRSVCGSSSSTAPTVLLASIPVIFSLSVCPRGLQRLILLLHDHAGHRGQRFTSIITSDPISRLPKGERPYDRRRGEMMILLGGGGCRELSD